MIDIQRQQDRNFISRIVAQHNSRNQVFRYSFQFMKEFLLINVLLLLIQTVFANEVFDSLYLKEKDFAPRAAALKKQFGKNKIITKELELECLAALSYYPELLNEHVEFRWDNSISSTMKMLPTFTSFLFHKKLKYVVYMNKSAATTNLNINELSFNAKVGWLGHELGHVLQCVEKSRLGVLWMGICHISDKFIAKFERETDIITIKHNLGYALYEGMHYTLNNKKVNQEYIAGLKKNYLSLDEILTCIKNIETRKPL